MLLRLKCQQVSCVFLFLDPVSQCLSKSHRVYLPNPSTPPSSLRLRWCCSSASPVTRMDATASHVASCLTLPPLQSAFHRSAGVILIKCKPEHSVFSWLRVASGIKSNVLNISHEALPDPTLAVLQLPLMPLLLSVHTGSFPLPQTLRALGRLEALAIAVPSA